ncbi:TetR/AcrR family transcriptional regulator [Pseudonocardia sp.]|uniref:TetR/AcrR family transcriptional regulator n=1 Tax=Pseudonocardia sp. TaxID=60912 RepID=UPI00260B75AF|nr:TetR/AcrR family transcriptional regulator [Pseudonocardia sp.]
MATTAGDVPRRRGRPVGFERLPALDALVELFWREGYDGATQEAMLASTGLSSSSLYRTFGTKDATFAAVLERYLELADGMLGPLERGGDGTAELQAFLDRVRDQLGGPMGAAGCLVLGTLCDPVNRSVEIDALTRRHVERMLAALRTAVERAAAAGDSLPIGSPATADVLLAGVLGVLTRARGNPAAALALLDGLRALVPARMPAFRDPGAFS